MNHDELVQQVKDLQRISKGHSQAWDRFCQEAGSSARDPRVKDDDFLQRFVDGVEMGLISTEKGAGKGKGSAIDTGGSALDDLVARVKEWQRRSKGHKLSWDNYVRESGRDKSLDPKSKDEAFLLQFLDATEQGLINTDYDEDGIQGKGKGGKKGGAGKPSGTSAGTDQPSADAMAAWNPAHGDKDAMLGYVATGLAVMIEKGKGKFGNGFLKLVKLKGLGKGLIDFNQSSGGKGTGSGEDKQATQAPQAPQLTERQKIVQQVKEFQRTSKGHKLAWDRYVEDAGSTKLDPVSYDNDFLQQFLDATEQGLVNTDFDEDEWNLRNAMANKGKDGKKGSGGMGSAEPGGKATEIRGAFGKGARSSPY